MAYSAASTPPKISVGELVRRALACRCPLCGRGALFRSHFTMNRECPNCHAVFWKDPGESLGAMYVDYAVASAAFLLSWLLLELTLNLSNLAEILILGAIAAGSVLVFYPLSRSFWTLLVYASGGIDRPPIQLVRGGKRAGQG
jgi:uncharacterized protein (DUF983 family)